MSHVRIAFVNTTSRAAAACGIVIIIMTAGCGSPKADPVQSDAEKMKLSVPVEVATVQTGILAVDRTYSASLEGEEQAHIVPKISERVAGVHVRVGQTVAANQLIVSLDKAGASSQFYQAQAAYRNAEKSLERMKSLYAEGAVSLQTLDGTQTAYDVAHANFVAARSMVQLVTPIAGVVTALNVSIGDLAMPGVTVATVAKIDRIKAIFSMNEVDVAAITVGQGVEVVSDARPDLTVKGNIVEVSRSADVRSRSFEVKALFTNTHDRWFRSGMFASVRLRITSKAPVMNVPNIAVQTDGVTSRVFVLKDGRAFLRAVRTGITDGERTAILEGVLPNDTVATLGVNNLRDSSLVVPARQVDTR
jgi:membrane fusion protein (multidrug efflux system)